MRKEYILVDIHDGRYIPFKKIHNSIEDCKKVANSYNLYDYIIAEREVSAWKKVETWKN